MHAMKVQFSLATLLIITTVLAIVCAVCVALPVRAELYRSLELINPPKGEVEIRTEGRLVVYEYHRPPTASEIAIRLSIFGPLAIAAVLLTQWALRKMRRHQGRSDG